MSQSISQFPGGPHPLHDAHQQLAREFRESNILQSRTSTVRREDHQGLKPIPS